MTSQSTVKKNIVLTSTQKNLLSSYLDKEERAKVKRKFLEANAIEADFKHRGKLSSFWKNKVEVEPGKFEKVQIPGIILPEHRDSEMKKNETKQSA